MPNLQAYGVLKHDRAIARAAKKNKRENNVERYLHKQVTLRGGTTKKLTGRINDPDRLVIWTHDIINFVDAPTGGRTRRCAYYDFVETKAQGKKPRPGQLREHKRLRDRGCNVLVLDTCEKVDKYVGSILRYVL